ncbi:ATP-dependent DNA helicase PIF1-like protein [Tanacetum coccineum]
MTPSWSPLRRAMEVFFCVRIRWDWKDFLWKTLAAGIRRKGDVVLNVASSGISYLLMTGGRTAHSRFKIPINIDELSTCSINPQSDLDHCKVLRLTVNMRLTVGCRPEDVSEIRDFVEWILKLGDGDLGDANDGEAKIDIPDEMLIKDPSDQ